MSLEEYANPATHVRYLSQCVRGLALPVATCARRSL